MSQPSAPPSYMDATEKTAYNQGAPYPPQTGYAQPGYAPYPAGQPQPQPNYGYASQPVASSAMYSSPPDHPADMGGVESGFTTGMGFDNKDVRRMFIRKVFIILGIQLLVTFGIVCIFSFIPEVNTWIRANPGWYYAAYAVFIVLYFVLVCVESARRTHPHNLIMLGVFTLALSYMTGTIAAYYDTKIVAITLGVTVFVCVTVIVFSMQTRFDFTKCSGVLFVLLMVLLMFGFLSIFWHGDQWFQIAYGCLGAMIFTLFLAFDVQLIMGGRKYELDPEEYVFGALNLYIDVVYIFLFLLSLIGGSSGN